VPFVTGRAAGGRRRDREWGSVVRPRCDMESSTCSGALDTHLLSQNEARGVRVKAASSSSRRSRQLSKTWSGGLEHTGNVC